GRCVPAAAVSLHLDRVFLQAWVFGDARLCRFELLGDAGIDRARDIEIGVVVATQLDDRRNGLRLGQQRNLRLGIAHVGERARGGRPPLPFAPPFPPPPPPPPQPAPPPP